MGRTFSVIGVFEVLPYSEDRSEEGKFWDVFKALPLVI
jgi:hypothetical protein